MVTSLYAVTYSLYSLPSPLYAVAFPLYEMHVALWRVLFSLYVVIATFYAVLFLLCAVANYSLYPVLFLLCTEPSSLYASYLPAWPFCRYKRCFFYYVRWLITRGGSLHAVVLFVIFTGPRSRAS